MKIESLQSSDLTRLYDFFTLIHPDNTKDEIKSYIDHWLAKCPNAETYVSIQKEKDDIVGLDFNSPMSFYFNGEKHESGWGFDLYVKAEFREKNYGVDLLLYNKKNFPTNFATGSNPNAVKILNKMGGKQIGEIHKYVGVVGAITAIKSVFKKNVPISKYPDAVIVNNCCYEKIVDESILNISVPYNKEVIEINHDIDFIRWKFFKNYRKYAFYYDKLSRNYVVLRTIIKNHVVILMVSDFRCDVSSVEQLETMIQVVHFVAREIGVGFVFCGSSLATVDGVLEGHHYRAIGRHRPIITFHPECKKKEYENRVLERNYIFVNLSDSDGEPI